jgi:hypothetical protein
MFSGALFADETENLQCTGQHVTVEQCCFEANTLDVTVGQCCFKAKSEGTAKKLATAKQP